MAPEYGTPIQQLPLFPANVLKKHRVDEPLDTRFRSAARLLQALWREDRDLPIGSYVGEDGKRRKLGSRISEAAGRGGGNFLTPEIAHIARREAAYREIGAMIDQERLATNLLSSMPLTFNLLAPWGHTLERASGYLIELLPAFTGSPRQLLFEHSPGRGNPRFTADYTAFDALIRYSDHGRNGFVAFELKYSESMREPVPELKPRYDELSDASGLFTDPAAAALRTNPLQQLWREHLLAQSMIGNGLYDEGYLVTIAPALNYHVQDAADAYRAHLREPEDGKVRFVNLTLEDVIEAIRLSDQAHAEALHRRYCDFWLVDGELELNAARLGLPAKRTARKPANALEDAANPVPAKTPPKRRVSRGTMKAAALRFRNRRGPASTRNREPRRAEALPSVVWSFFHEDRTLRHSPAHHRQDRKRDRARRGRLPPALAPFRRQHHATRQYRLEEGLSRRQHPRPL